MIDEMSTCPNDGYAIGSDGRCIACMQTPDEAQASTIELEQLECDPEEPTRVVRLYPNSRVAQFVDALAAEHDVARAERGDDPPANAGAYDSDAVPIGMAEINAAVARQVEKEPSTEWLMRGPDTQGGGGSKGRSRSTKRPLICGEPCDCGGGLPCRITGPHNTHSCAECRGDSGAGRPRIEPGVPRNIHVTGRISERTAAAIETTGKSTATIMYELGRAIIEGRPYDWRNA